VHVCIRLGVELLGGVGSGTVPYPISCEDSVLSQPVGCRMVVISIRAVIFIRAIQFCILFVWYSMDVREEVDSPKFTRSMVLIAFWWRKHKNDMNKRNEHDDFTFQPSMHSINCDRLIHKVFFSSFQIWNSTILFILEG
jgi:hypothetical protein